MEQNYKNKLGDISKYDKDVQNVLISSAVEGNIPSQEMQDDLQAMAQGRITEDELIEKINRKFEK